MDFGPVEISDMNMWQSLNNNANLKEETPLFVFKEEMYYVGTEKQELADDVTPSGTYRDSSNSGRAAASEELNGGVAPKTGLMAQNENEEVDEEALKLAGGKITSETSATRRVIVEQHEEGEIMREVDLLKEVGNQI